MLMSNTIKVPIMQAVGKVCRQARLEHGARQIDVALATGYHSSLISHFEAGQIANAALMYWYMATYHIPVERISREVNL